jgi:HAD superfamily hydrolase (TIGR01509 family)
MTHRNTANISTVVFDVGNVLLDWSPRYLYGKIFDDAEEMDWFLNEVCTAAFVRELDGGLPYKQGVAALSARFPKYAAAIEAFDSRWPETLKGTIPGSVRLLERLSQRETPLYALTNFSAEKFAQTRPLYDFFDHFRGVLVSGEEGLLKPDPEIYRLLLERFGLNAQDCLFIDDTEANVVGAQNVGFAAVRFENPDQLEIALQDYGLL